MAGFGVPSTCNSVPSAKFAVDDNAGYQWLT